MFFGLFGCSEEIEKAKEEVKAEYDLKISELQEKIEGLEAELEKRKKCSSNTLDKLDEVDKVICNLKNEIIENTKAESLEDLDGVKVLVDKE